MRKPKLRWVWRRSGRIYRGYMNGLELGRVIRSGDHYAPYRLPRTLEVSRARHAKMENEEEWHFIGKASETTLAAARHAVEAAIRKEGKC